MIKVLVVEDDPMVAKFNQLYLGKVDGFILEGISSSYDEALRVLHQKPIDLVLLDIYMPGKSGLELLAEIRKLNQKVDVILITAASDIQTVNKALRFGVVDYLIKPFEFERFNEALSSYREEFKFIQELENINQEDLDKHLLYKDRPAIATGLPKGLTQSTLKMVWDHIEGKSEPFSTEEIAADVGISRVSLRKYLKFLSDIGIVNIEIVYGSIGRPVYLHQIIKEKRDLIKNYL
ncbi:response regulator [Brevibacillus ginsengisoli]|uniref:response regulator n=1 Tax=Brevibacillus ginsengisoli TaxID=363854 RepID=UPI003CF703CA